LFGTLYALLRVELEVYGRGLWLHHVANEDEVRKFKTDQVNISFGRMLKIVEEQIGLKSGPLTNLKSKQWRIFSSFTHTGSQAIMRRINHTHTGLVNYSEEELISALSVSGALALLSAAELSGLSGEQSLDTLTLEKARANAKNEL